MVDKIVIDGGPCGGKDACQTFILQKFGDRGFHPFFVPESPTLLMRANLTPGTGLRTFQRSVIQTMDHLERTIERAATESGHPKPIIFCNRGIPSAKAYMPNGMYAEIIGELGLGTEVEVRDRRYKAALLMRSTAVGAEDVFEKQRKNNPHRLENLPEAKIKDEEAIQIWNGHPHLRIIDNSTDFAGKLARLDREICALLGVPVPLEIERKLLCAPVDIGSIPVPIQKVDIEQMYLFSPDPKKVLRVRKRGQLGSFVYFETEKGDVRPGVRAETESFISAEQYAWSLRFQLPGTRIVKKSRYCFIYENQYFEFDVIPIGDTMLYLLEAELTEESQRPTLPPFLLIERDVTDDPHYTNRAIANLSWRP